MLNKSLIEILEEREKYSFSDPFDHYVIDDLFDPEILNQVGNTKDLLENANQFGALGEYNSPSEKKLAIDQVKGQGRGKVASSILDYLNSQDFVEFLENLTGIDNLETDPLYVGGGIHIIPRGGKLNVHIDFSRAHYDKSKYRRLNVLLYLNKDWQDSWNGALELWDDKPSDGGNLIKSIYPHFNRLIIFGTSKKSWHGHPTPLDCPEDVYRTSLATYYYSSEPGEDLEEHSTIF